MRTHAHGASRCQHVGADGAAPLLLSDFISECCLRVDESGCPFTHCAATYAAGELAPTPDEAEHSMADTMTTSSRAKEIERELSLAATQNRMTELVHLFPARTPGNRIREFMEKLETTRF